MTLSRPAALLLLFSASAAADVMLHEGVRVRVRLEESLSSAAAEEGQPVQLTVIEDVLVGDVTVIRHGSAALGKVIQAARKGRLARPGKLDFSVESVLAADGGKVRVRYARSGGADGTAAGRSGVLSSGGASVFWPAAPMIFRKGQDIAVEKGLVVDLFTDQRYVLREASTPAATLTFSTLPADAGIELDGVFAGCTPAALRLPAGLYNITVRKDLQVWSKTLELQPGGAVEFLPAPVK